MYNINQYTSAVFTALFFLVGCEGAESDWEESRGHELRGGATIILAEDTEFDVDELESREGYGATLTDTMATKWFVNVEHVELDVLDDLGLLTFPLNGDIGYLGTVWSEGGDRCQIYVPFDEKSFVRLNRPREEIDCPESIDEIGDWLPTVEVNGDDGFLRAFGDEVGSFQGIIAYSNGSNNTVTYDYNVFGMMWQCVEYVNRYYSQRLGHKSLKGTGNADDYFDTAVKKDLVAHINGVSTTAPAVGDMLASDGGVEGHIAIIRDVKPDYVEVIHQNWTNTSSDNSKHLSMSVSNNGRYSVGGFSAGYPVQGWMCKPNVSSVKPTTATLGQSTQFTVTGKCLPPTVVAWIPECANLMPTSYSSTHLKFTCTPSYSKGVKSGVVKYKPNGAVLKHFNVTVK